MGIPRAVLWPFALGAVFWVGGGLCFWGPIQLDLYTSSSRLISHHLTTCLQLKSKQAARSYTQVVLVLDIGKAYPRVCMCVSIEEWLVGMSVGDCLYY